MAIKGLTDGPATFPRIGKLRKGGQKTGNAPGKDLNYFRFDSTDPAATRLFKAAYGEEPKEINVILPRPTVDENFQTAMEQYGAGGIEVRCDREWIQGIRVNGKFMKCFPGKTPCQKEGEKPCQCKEVGRLQVIIPELQRFAYVTAETHSINDIVNLTQQLTAIQMTFGQLNGIPLVLRRRPEMISTPTQGGGRARREKWMLSIEVSHQWSELRLQATQQAALQQALVLNPGDEIDAPEPERINPRLLEPALPTVEYLNTELWYSIKCEFHKAKDGDRIKALTQRVHDLIAQGDLPPNAKAGLVHLIETAYDRLNSAQTF